MKKLISVLSLLCMVSTLFAQAQQAAPAQAAPAPEPNVVAQPKPHSQEEAQALGAVFNDPNPDTRIKAATDLLAKFPNTEFKPVIMQMISASYQQKGDFENMVAWSEKTLETDPKNFAAMIMLAGAYAQTTKDLDLDKEEKLGKVDKYGMMAVDTLKTAMKPNPALSDAEWEMAKKDMTAQAYEAMAQAALIRKKLDVAVGHLKTALATASVQEPTTKIRLAMAYNMQEKYDDAITLLDQVLADQQLDPNIRQYASQEKLKAATAKAKK